MICRSKYLLWRCTQIKTYSWDNAQVILVGNKSDMEDERVISYERGKQLADSLGLQFFETSAKENINVRVRKNYDWALSLEYAVILNHRVNGKYRTWLFFWSKVNNCMLY